jgi:hypothetical protein
MKIRDFLSESDQIGQVQQAMVSWLKSIKTKSDEYFRLHFENLEPAEFEVKPGGKFYKIIRVQGSSRSSWAFVDKKNGDIFKPASWAAPAKHARGNVLSDKNGMEALTPDGQFIQYLK